MPIDLSDAIISDVISRTDQEETSKLISNFYVFTSLKRIRASQGGLDVQFIDQFSELSLILAQILKNKVTIRAAEFS